MMLKKYHVHGYDYKQKTVSEQSKTASRVYLPASWAGKQVAIILLERLEKKEEP